MIFEYLAKQDISSFQSEIADSFINMEVNSRALRSLQVRRLRYLYPVALDQ